MTTPTWKRIYSYATLVTFIATLVCVGMQQLIIAGVFFGLLLVALAMVVILEFAAIDDSSSEQQLAYQLDASGRMIHPEGTVVVASAVAERKSAA